MAVATWVSSAAWTEFREWVGRQTTDREVIINQYEALGVEFNSLSLKFNVKSIRQEKADEVTREALLANVAAQEVTLDRIDKYLNPAEKNQVSNYQKELNTFRAKLDAINSFDDLKPFLIELGLTVDARDDLDKVLERVKSSYVPPLTTMRIGG